MDELTQRLLRYKDLEAEIFREFGYKEDWRKFPVSLELDKYWLITKPCSGGVVAYSPQPLSAEVIKDGGNLFSAHIYTYRHLDRWVYRAASHTMVLVDTRCDSNVWLVVFDNTKENNSQQASDLYIEVWRKY